MAVLKYVRLGLLGVLGLALLLVLLQFLYHRIKLGQEADQFPPPGQMVQAGESWIHVHASGEGPMTLVFLAGHGTSSPMLDFKPLWSRLESSYRVVVVERPGYGWSHATHDARTLDSMLGETRQALQQAGEEGPFVLMPHSMSGLEAIYWAQTHPEEVIAIAALDPAIPETVEKMPEPPRAQLYGMYLVSRLGLSRWMPEEEAQEALPLLKTGELSDEEQETYMAIFYKSAFSRDMLREARMLTENATLVSQNQAPPTVPMHFFISSDPMIERSNWQQILMDYVENLDNGSHTLLDTQHYVHYEKADEISVILQDFLQGSHP